MSPWVRFVEKVFRLPHRREEFTRVEKAAEELDERVKVLATKVDPLQAIAVNHMGEEQ